jgi:VWFA-related protein
MKWITFRRSAGLQACLMLLVVGVIAQEQQPPKPTFRSGRDLVSVDIVVRDRSGSIVKGLTAADFEVREDGRSQDVLGLSYQEISDTGTKPIAVTELLAGVEERMVDPASTTAAKPMTAQDVAGRRLMVLLFDTSSMQPEDVQRAIDSANKYVSEQMSEADLIAVATVSTTLNVLTDFTGDRAVVAATLAKLGYTEGTSTAPPDASTAATDEATATATTEATTEASDVDMFNNDVRLRALRTLSDTLAPLEQKKAIIYFSAGMQRSGQDNQIELRTAINSAVRAHVSIYPVDTRGLQAVVPGGDARQASGRGQSLFSGRGVSQQFAQLAASQDTLTSLAADTGGRAFTDANDFGEAFTRVRRDMSAYYLLGYSSNNNVKDGRFRRIQVRVKRNDLRVEARSGYFAERDFAHTNRGDRETQLMDQMFSAVSSTDLPVMVTAGFFRLAPDRYYVPIAVAVPGYAVPVTSEKEEVVLDVLGMVNDEQGRPLGRMRETLKFPPSTGTTLAGKQVLYQSGVTLPPGRYSVKVIVRENASGKVGSFEAPIIVPELKTAPIKVSSVVLSTQLQPAGRGRNANPLVRDGVQLVPNLTHVVAKDQKLFFYYEVYEERVTVDAPDRKAAVFQFELPAGSFTPGIYTCQINIIDAVASRFAFPRLAFYVK